MSLRGRLGDLLRDLTKPKRLENKLRMGFDLPGIEPQDPPEHHFCVAALARNEGRWIREWIEFHRLQGVEKNTRPVLQRASILVLSLVAARAEKL